MKARYFQEQNGWQISDRKSTDKINTADPYASHQTQLSSAHWKQGQGCDNCAFDQLDATSMKADDENLPGVRSSQGTPDKSFDGHNKWRNVDSRASDHVDSLHPFDSLHQPGRPSEVRGYDNQAFDHGYIKEADMNVGVRSNKYGPHVLSNKRTQPTRSFDGQNEWHNTGARTADHIDTINSPDHQDQGLSGKARSFEGEHGFEKSGRMDPGNVDNVRSFNQNHPGRSMENLDSSHNSDRHQSGWDHDNQDGKQVELSSDLKRKVARSDGHRGEWNQNDRRAAYSSSIFHQ